METIDIRFLKGYRSMTKEQRELLHSIYGEEMFNGFRGNSDALIFLKSILKCKDMFGNLETKLPVIDPDDNKIYNISVKVEVANEKNEVVDVDKNNNILDWFKKLRS